MEGVQPAFVVSLSSHPSHLQQPPLEGSHAVPQVIGGFHKSIILLGNHTLPPPVLAKQGWENASAPRCTRESSRSTSKLGATQEKPIFNDLMGL